jgi:hypothetical protein
MRIDTIRVNHKADGGINMSVTWRDEDGKVHVDSIDGPAAFVRSCRAFLIQEQRWPTAEESANLRKLAE